MIRLPARLDTLAALWLASELRAALGGDGRAVVDAGDVTQAGLVALQLLHSVEASVDLVNAGTLDVARRDAGLADDALPAGRALSLRLDDSALLFGQEPLEILAALRAAGVGIGGALPRDALDLVREEPDRLRLTFRLVLPDAIDRSAVETILVPIAGSYVLDQADAGDEVREGSAPSETVAVPRGKLDALAVQVAALAAAQSSLIERMGAQAARLSIEVAEMERRMRALQEGMAGVAMSRIGDLLRGRPCTVVEGEATEIDHAVFDRIAPAFDALLAASGSHAASLAATTDGGFVTLRLALAVAADLDPLRAAARTLGGRLDADADGGRIDIHLPRSLTLLDALIVEVGSTRYAIPVAHVIQALRPSPGDMHRLDPDRSLLRFRGRYLPVAALGRRFGNEGWERDPCAAVLIAVRAGDGDIALMADTISDQRQIAVRPFAGIAPPPGIAGAAIVGGNRIALVVDLLAFEPDT